ncbi:uncharacterized protein TNCV_2644071 [Trichonephila clavipes]|nr:uncharacterized protein TNCV_2644071 [Trichonephila clavipes]
MIEHLIIGLKTPPKQIGIDPTPDTGRWKFINQHGHVGRLNKVNLARLYRSKAKRKVFFHKKHVVVNVDHSLVGIFQESIGISQQSFGDFLPQDIVGPEFVHVLGLQDGTLEIIQQRLFLVPIVFAKQDKHSFRVGFLINDASTDVSLPSGMYQGVGLLRQRHGHHGRGNVLRKGINLIHCALKGSVD